MFGKNDKHQVDFEVFTVYDSKTQSYEVPSFALNHHDLIRQIINMFKDPAQKNNRFLINAEDYSVFRIGTFDKRSGVLQAGRLEHIANMHDLRAVAMQKEAQSRPDLQQVGMQPT